MQTRLCIFTVALSLCAAILVAQTNRGGINGTVSDPSGAVVPNATVTITNVGTNETRKTQTSTIGTFSVQDLEPVVYRIQVEADGFKKEVVENVKVDTATVETVLVKLEAGSVNTQITISANAVMVNTESGTTGSTVTEREIQDVPLLNRSVLDLALTLANVSGDAGSEHPTIVSTTTCPGCNLSLNGGRPLNTLMLADGANNTGISLARSIVSFTPETVQEFTVQTSVYSAEYSSTGGGVINATTKSGSNRITGTALWYNRNPAFAAAPYTIASANRSPATLKDNQFSIAAGGPVFIPSWKLKGKPIYDGRNKTFWFGAIEPEYRRDYLDQYALVPTAANRMGDFSGMVNTASGFLPASVAQQFGQAVTGDATLYQNYAVSNNQFTLIPAPTGNATYVPFPNNVIPASLLDPSAVKALQYLAPPGTGGYYLNSNGTVSNLDNPRLLREDTKRYTLRIDQMINDRNRLYGRYSATPIIKTQNYPVSPTSSTAEYSYGKQLMVADTHTFSPTVMNDLRLNYTRGRFSSTVAPAYDADTGININTLLGLPSITKGGVPLISGLGVGSGTGVGIGSGASTEVEDREERYALADIVYKSNGRMSWKFGVDFNKQLQNVIPLYAALGGNYAFSNIQTDSTGTASGTGGNSFASFLLGVPNGSVALRSTEVPYYYRWYGGGAFVQNDWKIKPNLTLNLGMRWNLELPRIEKYNNQGVFRPDLAETMQLPTPTTLTDGEVITSTLVPPFQFAGRGGNSPYLTPPDWKDFEPRFGFAWSPSRFQARRVVIRGGYGLSHAPVNGANRLPQPDFGATANYATQSPSSTANPTDVMRLGYNPPVIIPQSVQQVIFGNTGPPANGLVYLNSLYYQNAIGGFAISPNYHTPYVQNWNFTISWQMNPSTTMEVTYVGNKGTHLFMPHEDLNPKDQNLLNAQDVANISTTATVNDPLGRISPGTGKVLTDQNSSLGSPYLGFSSLYQLFDASGDSVRHAAYVNVLHRVARGLTFTANYTFGKSIDDGSSAGGDKNVLGASGGQVDGQVAFGAPRFLDRSVSTYNQTHVIHSSYIYDLPFGRGRAIGNNLWKPLDLIAGGWTTSSTITFNSGFPATVYLSDTNQLGDLTHTARPNLLTGVPIINPLYNSSCPLGASCQPYLNPSAFERPVLGEIGNAPRTIPWATGPWNQFFNASIQKSFRFSESNKYRLQFRVDFLNAFNHPTFGNVPDNAGGADFMGQPSTSTLTTAAYNIWASANNQPLYSTTAGAAIYNQIIANVNAQKTAGGGLPTNFYTIPLPANFYGTQANSYNITTIQGYKLYQLRNAYSSTATANFGTLYNNNTPRYIQFGVKLYF
jgi:hypothetical protein